LEGAHRALRAAPRDLVRVPRGEDLDRVPPSRRAPLGGGRGAPHEGARRARSRGASHSRRAVNLILIAESEVKDGAVRLDGDRAKHITSVLRSSLGDRLRVGVIDGPLGTASVRAMGDGWVELDGLALDAAPPAPTVDLLLAL